MLLTAISNTNIKKCLIFIGIIVLLAMLIFILKLLFTYIANRYVYKNREHLFNVNSQLAVEIKELGHELMTNLHTYQLYVDDLGIAQVYECSSSIVSNASNSAVKYLIKYSNLDNSEYCLERIDYCINYMQSLENLRLKIQSLQKGIHNILPVIIRIFVTKSKIPYTVCNISYELATIENPEFCFSYVSPAGRSERSYTIELTPSVLKSIESEINAKIAKTGHSRTQRGAMTNDLREAIKKRDNYTCCICGNSVFKEPNLLLEVDHIIPVSKGGKTEASNLQTLCWRCNREKSNN